MSFAGYNALADMNRFLKNDPHHRTSLLWNTKSIMIVRIVSDNSKAFDGTVV